MVHSALVPNLSLRERVGALRHLPALFRLVWQASPSLTAASLGLRLGRTGAFDNVIKVRPPLVFTPDNARMLLEGLDRALEQV